MWSSVLSCLKRLRSDRGGNVVIIVAFALVPLLGSLGLATDYGLAVAIKNKLDHAADAASIAAIAAAQSYIVNYTGTGDPTAGAVAAGKAQAQAQFNANTAGIPGAAPTPTIVVTPSGLNLSATVQYSFPLSTFAMRIFGTTTTTVSGSSTSTLAMPGFNNIYIVIDTSSSMGIGATLADQQTVYNATNGCAVACHYSGTTATARNAGATLRIDIAKQAVSAALNQMIATGNSSRFKVAIYTFSNQFTNVFPLSGNLQNAIAAVNGIDISNANYDGGTNATYSLAQLSSALPTAGTGLTSASPLGTVMLITDGVQDSDTKSLSGSSWVDGYDSNFTPFNPCNQSNCKKFTQFASPIYVESLDPNACTSIKNKGNTLMTLNTTYIVPPSNLQSSNATLNSVFTYIQSYLLSSISSNMSACASSSANAYTANTPAEINTAVTQMFQATGALARITQ
ncbi:TadE/TadG family type IV pilus assembly protein [Methylobacterium sp. JK268]